VRRARQTFYEPSVGLMMMLRLAAAKSFPMGPHHSKKSEERRIAYILIFIYIKVALKTPATDVSALGPPRFSRFYVN